MNFSPQCDLVNQVLVQIPFAITRTVDIETSQVPLAVKKFKDRCARSVFKNVVKLIGKIGSYFWLRKVSLLR